MPNSNLERLCCIGLLVTPPLACHTEASAQTKFAAFGDIGMTSDSAKVAELTRKQGVGFILMLGDLCYGSKPIATQIDANYKTEKADGDLWPALGNHDFTDACGGGNNASAYRAYFTLPNNERYYDFKRGPVHFFALNSHKDADGLTATSKQALWLKAKLAASTSPWQIVFFHHPPYSSGEHGSTSRMRWPFEAWGADAVLAAHDHDYERIMLDVNKNGAKIPYIVSGMGGESRRSFSTIVSGSVKRYNRVPGALIVSATSTSLTFQFRNVAGSLIDSYTKSKSSAAQTEDAFTFREVPKE